MGDLPYIEWLARDYKKRAEISGHWTDYIKAHGLANYCVVKDSREERCQLVYSIEESWYNGRHPLSYVEHQQLIRQQKSRLKSYRDETCNDYTKLDVEANGLVARDPFSEENLSLAKSFSKKVFAASKRSSEKLLKMSKYILSSSVEMLQCIDMTAPCMFAVIGLGSLAKGEATPYSDLEYAFIVERETETYFEKLAVDSYFRIGNLGETPLKHFDITDLTAEKGCAPIISDTIPAGFRIDGLTKKAGNIPTGNGKDSSKALTLTVDKLMELYTSSARSPFEGIAGDMLASSVVIYTNEGDKSKLYDKFVRARLEFELMKAPDQQSVRKNRIGSFIHDIDSYTFLPEFIRFQPPKNLDIKVKADIFRYPTLLANNIKMLMGWTLVEHSWDIFSNLHKQGMLSDENYQYITIMLALSMYMRTSAYISCGYQAEFISLIPTTDVSPTSKYHVPGAIFVLLGSLLVPIKQSIKADVQKMTADIGSMKEMLTSILQNIEVSKTNLLQRAEVCYFAGRYDLAKMNLDELIGLPIDSITCSRFWEIIRQTGNDVKSAEKYVELCCYALYYTGCYKPAVSYLEWLIEKKQGNVGLLKLLTAHCKTEDRDYKTARRLLNETKQSDEGLYTADNHQDTYTIYTTIASVHQDLGKYKESVAYSTQALAMCEAINGELHSHTAGLHNVVGITQMGLGNYTLALEHTTKSLDIGRALYGTTSNHPLIAVSCSGLGIAYRYLGDHELSLEHHDEALEKQKATYGPTANHPDIADSYNYIGSVHGDLGDYQLSLKHHKTAMNMTKAIYGGSSNHPKLAELYTEIGRAYSELGKHTLSLEYLNKSLTILEAIHGANVNSPAIADLYDGIGNARRSLGKCTLSLDYHHKALDMRKAIHGADTNHSKIAESYESIGSVHLELEKYHSALQYYHKSLNIMRTVYGANTDHVYIATNYYNLGRTYGKLGNYTKSLE